MKAECSIIRKAVSYIFLVLMAALLTSCVRYVSLPDVKDVPREGKLPIDGTYVNKNNALLHIEGKRIFYDDNVPPPYRNGMVFAKGIKQISSTIYSMEMATHRKDDLSVDFGPAEIEVLSENKIRTRIFPNKKTNLKKTLINELEVSQLDDKSWYLSELKLSKNPSELIANYASTSDIDKDLPKSIMNNENAVAIVIGNRDYIKSKKVDYAVNDAQAIKEYLTNVLGFKEGNIFYISNASKSDFELYFGNEKSYKGKLYNSVKEDISDIFIYYSGHGAPGLKDHKGYFVPVEADPQYLELTGYSADIFYQNLSKIPARSLTVILDACFSGATVYEKISPIILEINNPVVNLNNGVVLSSSTGSQISSWYDEKNHGMFTYFFLKAIHNKNADYDKNGNITFDEIYKYISDNSEGVPYYARRINGVEQTPTIEGNYRGKVLVRY